MKLIINGDVRKWLQYLRALSLPKRMYLKLLFKKHLGYKLNLDNPKTLNEKLQWLKLYNNDPLMTICSDKYRVREFVSNKIGEQYLIPLLNVFENADDIKINLLPDIPFIVKANHTSGTFYIFKSKEHLDINFLKLECSKWLRQNYYTLNKEWQYKNIKPNIIVEELLLDDNGRIPSDVKLICINGKVEIIHIDSNKEIEHLRNNYDRDWNPLSFCWPAEYRKNQLIERPDKLDLMIELAEKLAESFHFVRVDFYINKGRIYFGELTFHPTSGFGQFSDVKYDLYYGELLNINDLRML